MSIFGEELVKSIKEALPRAKGEEQAVTHAPVSPCEVRGVATARARRALALVHRERGRCASDLRWVLDVTMNAGVAHLRCVAQPQEERAAPTGAAAAHGAAPARVESKKGSMRGKLKRAGWQDGFLLDLIRAAVRID